MASFMKFQNNQLQHDDDELLIDGTGLHLLPGVIDPQVHFRDPGQPEKEDLGSGSAAAVNGVTSFLDMPNNKPSIVDLPGMQSKLDTAAAKCVNNYGFFIGATPNNVERLKEAGTPDAPIAIPGICGIKIFMGSSTGTLLVNEENSRKSFSHRLRDLLLYMQKMRRDWMNGILILKIEPILLLTLNGETMSPHY